MSAPEARARYSSRLAPVVLVLPAGLFLLAFFIVPTVELGLTSFWRTSYFTVEHDWNLDQFHQVWQQPGVQATLIRSLLTGVLVAGLTTTLAYPVAHYLRFRAGSLKSPLLGLIVTVMFSGYLVKIYAWRTLMGREGALNWALQATHLTDHPLLFLFYNRFAVVITLVHIFLPFAILLVLAALEGVDADLLDAPRALGARFHHVALLVVLPLVGRSLFAAFSFVFVLSAADYVTPQFVGGTSGSMLGVLISIDMLQNGEYSKGSALSLIFVASLALVIAALYVIGKLAYRVVRAA